MSQPSISSMMRSRSSSPPRPLRDRRPPPKPLVMLPTICNAVRTARAAKACAIGVDANEFHAFEAWLTMCEDTRCRRRRPREHLIMALDDIVHSYKHSSYPYGCAIACGNRSFTKNSLKPRLSSGREWTHAAALSPLTARSRGRAKAQPRALLITKSRPARRRYSPQNKTSCARQRRNARRCAGQQQSKRLIVRTVAGLGHEIGRRSRRRHEAPGAARAGRRACIVETDAIAQRQPPSRRPAAPPAAHRVHVSRRAEG